MTKPLRSTSLRNDVLPVSRPRLARPSMKSVGMVLASAAMLAVCTSARCEPVCDTVKKYVEGKAARPVIANHGPSIGSNAWKARTQIPPGDCTIAQVAKPRQYTLTCTFNEGAAEADLTSFYQGLTNSLQQCVDGLDSRTDWRKRNASGTTA